MRNVSTVYQRRAPQQPSTTIEVTGRARSYRRIKAESSKGVHLGLYAPTVIDSKGSQAVRGGTIRLSVDAATSSPGHERACIPVISLGGLTTVADRAGEVGIRLSAPNNPRFVREARPTQNLRRLVATSRLEPVGYSLIPNGHTTPRSNNGGGTTQDHSKSPDIHQSGIPSRSNIPRPATHRVYWDDAWSADRRLNVAKLTTRRTYGLCSPPYGPQSRRQRLFRQPRHEWQPCRIDAVGTETRIRVRSRFARFHPQRHSRFARRIARLAMVATLTSSHDIFPSVLAAFAARHDVIQCHFRTALAAVLACVAVALEHFPARELATMQGFANHVNEADHLRSFKHPGDCMDVFDTVLNRFSFTFSK